MATESTLDLNLGQSNAIVFPKRDPLSLALTDFKEGMMKWRIWVLLAYQDIKLRYRRSVLGPFWVTLSMAITVYSMGFLYGHLFHMELKDYYPFLVAGMLAWSLISTSLNELTDTFSGYENLIKQIKLPYTLHIQRVMMRNVLIFFHNVIVMIPVYIIFHEGAAINLHSLFLLPALFIIYVNCLSFGLLLAILAARYRDISQIIKSIIQVFFFITPVMWNPAALPANKFYFVSLNPFYSFLELIRAPLLGKLPSASILLTVLGITAIGIIFSFRLFMRYRSRIIYWL